MANHSTSFRGIGRGGSPRPDRPEGPGEAAGWRPVGDRALQLEITAGDLVAANAAARAIARDVRAMDLAEVEDVVPAARTVLVILRPGAAAPQALVAATAGNAGAPDDTPARIHEIPVVYGGEAGPDLAEVAGIHGLSEDEAARRHGEPLYTVGFLGFAPGFAYLLGLPPDLVTPRLATPRTRIPAGSVAIGGELTGIYPRPTPGGWRLIGRTEVELFDPGRNPPALFAPGDRVRFVRA